MPTSEAILRDSGNDSAFTRLPSGQPIEQWQRQRPRSRKRLVQARRASAITGDCSDTADRRGAARLQGDAMER